MADKITCSTCGGAFHGLTPCEPSEPKPTVGPVDFQLFRTDAATLIYALDTYITDCKKRIERAQSRARRTGVHKPGFVAGEAVAAADGQQLRERIMRLMVDNNWMQLKPVKATK